MKLFNRKKNPVVMQAEVIEEEETGIEAVKSIEVRDIKQFLVDEYERARKLVAANDGLQEKVDRAEETAAAYSAALVTLDEYRRRIEEQDARIAELREKVEEQKEAVAKERDRGNTLEIRMHSMKPEKVALSMRGQCIDAVSRIVANRSGNLSQERVIRVLRAVDYLEVVE